MPHVFDNIELQLLVSSTFAIAGTLSPISAPMKTRLEKYQPTESLEDGLNQDYEALDEMAFQKDEA